MKNIIIGLVLVQTIGCFSPEIRVNPIVPQKTVPVQTPSPENNNGVVKVEGWEIPGLKGSTVKIRERIKSKGDKEIIFSELKTKISDESLTTLSPSFFTDDERRKLKFFSGNYELIVGGVKAYEIKGQKFCYVTSISPKGVGAEILLYFYDKDGDGRFETVKDAPDDNFFPELPDWAK